MSDSVRPLRWQPTRLPCPWDPPGKSTGVGCHFLLQCMKVKSESEVAQSCATLSHPMDCSLPGSSIHGTGVGCHCLPNPNYASGGSKTFHRWKITLVLEPGSLGPNASSDTHQLKEKNLYGPQSYLIRAFSNSQLPHCIHCKTNYKNKCMKSQFGQMDYFHIP